MSITSDFSSGENPYDPQIKLASKLDKLMLT